MKKICYIFLVLLAVSSCSIREERDDCPSFLGLTVTSQYDFIFQEGKAWCDLFSEDGSRFEDSPLEEMNARDTTIWYRIFPRRTVSAVVSNKEIVAGNVVANYGEEFCELWAFRKDIVCLEEEVNEMIYKQDKQFCNLTVQLSEAAKPMASELIIRVNAPYDGMSFPAMKAHMGDYLFRTIFDENGKATIRLPRQGGQGLMLYVQKIDSFTSTYNLYDIMSMAHYDWNAASLDDFELTASLNSVSGDIEIIDWEVVNIGDQDF